MLLYQTLAFTIRGKIYKSHTKIINLKYQLRQGMKNLNYLMGHILYQIFKTYFEYIIKKHETVTNNPSIMIHINKIENGITFKIITVYYLELLVPETMKLLGSTKNKIKKIKLVKMCLI